MSITILYMAQLSDHLVRFVNVGNPTRMLAIGDPDSDSILPMDDEVWNSAVSDYEVFHGLF